MKLVPTHYHTIDTSSSKRSASIMDRVRAWRPWFGSWELYLLLLVATFLRFYRLDTTEFDDDQTTLFRMAHDALVSGLLPATSNTASIGISHPPGVIYFFMLPAALSSNPLGGAMMVAAFSTFSVLLTYIFARRYFGRLAATVAAFTYATAPMLLGYERTIWQPNLMPTFVVLFMFTLYLGAVERRKGWLFPALVLLGVLYQMHEDTLYLVVPLLLALFLALRTLRFRDIVYAGLTLVLILFPYLLWLGFTHFADIFTAVRLLSRKAVTDSGALRLYFLFLHPYDRVPTTPQSAVHQLAPWLAWLGIIMPCLAIGGAVICTLGQWKRSTLLKTSTFGELKERLWQFLRDGRDAPLQNAYLLLLIWQIVPLLLLSRHTNPMTWHYLLLMMPGPFLLIGLCVAKIVAWLGIKWQRRQMLRYGVYALISLILLAQGISSMAALIDASSGYISDRIFLPYPYHNDLHSLQHALDEADQLAQQRHLHRVYITTDAATQSALRYLTEQRPSSAPTPILFDATQCLVLPNPANGPAVLLVGPYDDLTKALLRQFTRATLVEQPARLGDAPFNLYIVQSMVLKHNPTSSSSAFKGNLQLLDAQARRLSLSDISWLVTRWSLLHAEQRQMRTTYTYEFKTSLYGSDEQGIESKCSFSSMQLGDQLLAAFKLPAVGTSSLSSVPTTITVRANAFTTLPYNPWYGPFHLETNTTLQMPTVALLTEEDTESITLPVM